MLKATGIVRKVDDLGRICIPRELRRVLQLGDREPLEMYTDGESIIMKKYQPGCIHCGSMDVEITFKGSKLCKDCIRAIKLISSDYDPG